MAEENKYHFGREIIFNLRSCNAINEKVYLHWIDKLQKDEASAGKNDIESPELQLPLGDVMCRCSICDEDKNKKDMYDEICCYSCWDEEMTNYLYRNDSAHNGT